MILVASEMGRWHLGVLPGAGVQRECGKMESYQSLLQREVTKSIGLAFKTSS